MQHATVKINQLEIENVKRVKAVALSPAETGLTVIGGDNNQGKTSVLDAIAWALGGEKYRPSAAAREGSVLPPHIKLTLSNGLLVERGGKNGSLKVTDPEGRKSGQQLLNEFVEALALDLPKFMTQNNREKADTLLRIIGVEEQVHALERRETELYNRRHAVGQEADRKAKYAQEMTYYPDAPNELVSASELIRRQQDILARNGENQRKRADRDRLAREMMELEKQYDELGKRLTETRSALDIANKTAAELTDESTAELERDIANVEAVNIKVRANLDREKAEEDAKYYRGQYDSLTGELEAVRKEKYDLLNNAALPLDGLSVADGELAYNGRKWDGMSGSDQLRVSTAIVRAINPKCGFVLLDKLEQMDLRTLADFGLWLEEQGLQAIATRVSTGEECSIIIEDGSAIVAEDKKLIDNFLDHAKKRDQKAAPTWQKGVF